MITRAKSLRTKEASAPIPSSILTLPAAPPETGTRAVRRGKATEETTMFTRSQVRRALLVPVLAAAVLAAPRASLADEDPWGREAFRGGHETHEAWRENRRDERRDWRRDFVEDREDFFDRREEFFDRREDWRDRREDWRDHREDWRDWRNRFDRHAFGRNHGRFDRHRFGRRFDDGFGDGFPPRRYFPPRRHHFGRRFNDRFGYGFPPRRHGFGGHDHFNRGAFGGHHHHEGHGTRGGFRWSR